MMKGLENVTFEECLREVRLFSSGKNEIEGRPQHSLQLPERRLTEVGVSLFSSDKY